MQVGFIYATGDDIIENYGNEVPISRVEGFLKAEVEEYDAYLRGDVYCYRVTADDGTTDMCGGYYGSDGLKAIFSETGFT